MVRIDGKVIARKIIEELKKLPKPEKVLAAIFVGVDESSAAFLRRKGAIANELGVKFVLYQLDENISQEELEKKVEEVSNDERVGGLIVQLPLPKKFDRDRVLAKINPKKDVDALTDESPVEAPVVGVVKEILTWIGTQIPNPKSQIPNKFQNQNFKNLNIAVIGKGLLVGKPVIKWLERETRDPLRKSDSEASKRQETRFKVADSSTKNLREFLSNADLVITGVGKAGLINPQWLKEGAGVIDFGFPPDLDQEPLVKCQMLNVKCPELAFWTPTPGGTGPILVAMLFRNFYELNRL